MGKYEPLGRYLAGQPGDAAPMTFAEIERVIAAPLPPKAQLQRAWWSNNASNNVMTRVWLEAGFETREVDIAARRLVFRRVKPRAAPVGRAEARHPAFGALKGLLTIRPGVDLTSPADADWTGEGR